MHDSIAVKQKTDKPKIDLVSPVQHMAVCLTFYSGNQSWLGHLAPPADYGWFAQLHYTVRLLDSLEMLIRDA